MMNDRERWITEPRLAKRESAARLGSRWTNGEPPAACDEGDRGRSYQFGVVADVELFQLLAVFRFPWACRLEQPGSLPDETGNQSMPFAPPVALWYAGFMAHIRTYSLTIEPAEDGGYLAYFRAHPGCHTWGATYQEAVTNAEEALAVYVETLNAHGDPLPDEPEPDRSVTLGVIVPERGMNSVPCVNG